MEANEGSDLPRIIHGSEDSLDLDAFRIVPEPMERSVAKRLCDSFKDENANLIAIKDGAVYWCYKGTADECNNAILATYGLHEQSEACPITRRAERSYATKMMRCVRGLLSHCSRTNLRQEIKRALKSSSWDEKTAALGMIDLTKIDDFEKNATTEVHKFFAFQMGQTAALLANGTELFTKGAVSEAYPELAPYLARSGASPKALQDFMSEFVKTLSASCSKVERHQLWSSKFNGKTEVFDCGKETVLPPVVIFDIDGTLMDETHRAEYRLRKEHMKYFDLCHLDEPIIPAIEMMNEYKERGYEVWLMTGRAEICREKTESSLSACGAKYDKLKMRSMDVRIPDYVLKPAWVSKYVGLERVEAVFDDQEKVLEGFRSKGLNAVDIKEALFKRGSNANSSCSHSPRNGIGKA